MVTGWLASPKQLCLCPNGGIDEKVEAVDKVRPDIEGSRNRDAVKVALDGAFVEGVHACGRS